MATFADNRNRHQKVGIWTVGHVFCVKCLSKKDALKQKGVICRVVPAGAISANGGRSHRLRFGEKHMEN